MDNNNDNIGSLLELVRKVNSDLTCSENPPINLIQSKELFEEFEFLHENIYNHKNFSLNTNNRLENILQILSEMANMNFSGIAEVKDNFDHLDYFAFSLNHTSDRIKKEVEFLGYFKNVLDTLRDSYIITDEKGTIIHANKVLKDLFGIDKTEYKGVHIKAFFNSFQIKSKFSVEFLNTCGNHGIIAGYNENKIADTVLRVSSKAYLTKEGNKQGYCYKLERMNHTTYRENHSADTVKFIESIYKEVVPDSETEQKELLLSISRQYALKTELNYREILILNSINKQLEGWNK